MNHIKRDYRSKASVSPLGRLRGWGQKVKIPLLQNMVMLHIKLMRITNAAEW